METTGRVTYHVVFAEHEGWNLVQENSGRVVGTHRSRTNAILQGRDMAKTHSYSLLVIHDREDRIEKQYNYGLRPRDVAV
ncbi:MAG: DUF2188 domain-containing protein [Sedimentisphaerales bacterium]|jgi:hypothetical protein|nr:DUF2188 domain-containing protein [Sedimentisphaerales bacterium]NLT77949.1 DUF2188 domain-containing protein [Planctomycetota bacterium]